MAQTEAARELRALARDIAEHLPGYALEAAKDGDDWGHYSRLYYAGSEGRGLYLNRADGRLHISGMYPRRPDGQHMGPREWGAIGYQETAPSISVSASKTPEHIARDIARRFLAVYEPIYAKCAQALADLTDYRATGRANADAILKAFGGLARDTSRNASDDEVTLSVYHNGAADSDRSISIDVRVAATYVRFDRASMPVELARRIAETVRAYVKP